MFAAIAAVVGAIVGLVGKAIQGQQANLANMQQLDNLGVTYQYNRELALNAAAAQQMTVTKDLYAVMFVAVVLFLIIVMFAA